MSTSPQEPLKDEDIESTGASTHGPKDATDADGADGTDADGTDGTDGGDADGTDGGDADGTDGPAQDSDGTDS